MKIFVVLLTFLTLSGCISQGPDKEVKNKLGYLNGKTYGNSPDPEVSLGPGIPIVAKVHNRPTLIEGSIYYKNNEMPFPIGHQKIVLKDIKGKILRQTQSNAAGEFKFELEIPNGPYQIELASEKYTGKINFEVKSYEIKNLRLQAK